MNAPSEQSFRVVFYGRLDEAIEKSQIQQGLVDRIKMSEKAAEALLKSAKAMVKKNLSQEAAEKYQRAFEKIGVFLEIEPMPSNASSAVRAPNQKEETQVAASPASSPDLTLAVMSKDKPLVNNTTAGGGVRSNEEFSSEETDSVEAAGEQSPSARQNNESVNTEEFRFDGNGFEYFKIWIVNILLTIVTVGIYSAWAKVRNHQYFYGHTELASARFQYLASPISILIGRLIVVPVVIVGNFLSQIMPLFALIFGLFILGVMPWVFYRSLRFQLRNSAYRNIRFDFNGGYWGAVKVLYLWPILGMLTLGLLIPFSVKKMQAYIANHTAYGQTGFRFEAPSVKDYYIQAALFIAAVAIGYGFGFGLSLLFPLLMFVGIAMGYVVGIAIWTAGTTNLYFNHTFIENNNLIADYEVPGLIKVFMVNTLLMVLTLGLYFPWAKVRVARYRAEHTGLNMEGSMETFMDSGERSKSSIGEELGDALDLGVVPF